MAFALIFSHRVPDQSGWAAQWLTIWHLSFAVRFQQTTNAAGYPLVIRLLSAYSDNRYRVAGLNPMRSIRPQATSLLSMLLVWGIEAFQVIRENLAKRQAVRMPPICDVR
jgi:hypothetical protein